MKKQTISAAASGIDALLSVAPSYAETVTVGGIEIEIQPISLMSLAKLLRRFPEALKVLLGEHSDPTQAVVGCGPEAIAALVSAGVGQLNDIQMEQKIASLPDDWQAELLGEILRITMPDGLESFLGRFLKIAEKVGLIK